MENPVIKNLLKTAREAIKAKDFKEALKLCKQVIDKDKENYLGWVMTGAAAFESQISAQALAAYQRAIQISHDQAPAWQV
jgi:superkiller protein 3